MNHDELIARSVCVAVEPWMVPWFAITDLITFVCYMLIPIVAVWASWGSRSVFFPLRRVLWRAAAFIFFCGVGHLIDIWVLWDGSAYWAHALNRAPLAAASLAFCMILPSTVASVAQDRTRLRRLEAERKAESLVDLSKIRKYIEQRRKDEGQ